MHTFRRRLNFIWGYLFPVSILKVAVLQTVWLILVPMTPATFGLLECAPSWIEFWHTRNYNGRRLTVAGTGTD